MWEKAVQVRDGRVESVREKRIRGRKRWNECVEEMFRGRQTSSGKEKKAQGEIYAWGLALPLSISSSL